MCQKVNKFKIFFIIFNMVLPVFLFLIQIILLNRGLPFDDREIEELRASYISKPLNLLKLNNSYNRKNTVPLFGGYKGLEGGHKYSNCYYTFNDTCASDIGMTVHCPTTRPDEEEVEVDKSSCVDYPQIPAFNYTCFSGKCYYAEKKSEDYEKLKNYTVKEGQNCPDNKIKCGYLNDGLILCLDNKEDCPINDIVINDSPNYSDNNIIYKNILFLGNKYIHFTNEKRDNRIIFDLLYSIEHPLSKIETNDDQYDKIFKLHEREKESYFSGNIDNIKAYKQFYNTEITLKDFLILFGKYQNFANMPKYKTTYFDSKIFIYKKYPLTLSITTQQCKDINNHYETLSSSTFIAAFLICGAVFFQIPFLIKNKSLLFRIVWYILLSALDSLIIFLLAKKLNILIEPGILQNFSDKNAFRIKLLILRISFIVYVILQNAVVIIAWRKYCKEERENNNGKDLLNENTEAPLY